MERGGQRRFDNILAPAGNFLLYDNSSDSDNDSINDGAGGSGAYQSATSTWVFGYGSLCWNPGFEFSKCVTGYIRGYVRRFWQGNNSHRGTVEKVNLKILCNRIYSENNFFEKYMSERKYIICVYDIFPQNDSLTNNTFPETTPLTSFYESSPSPMFHFIGFRGQKLLFSQPYARQA